MPTTHSLFKSFKNPNRSAPSLSLINNHQQIERPHTSSTLLAAEFLPTVYINEPEEDGGARWCAFNGNNGSPWSSSSGSLRSRCLLDVPIPDIAALEETIARLRNADTPTFRRPVSGLADSGIPMPKLMDSTSISATWEEIVLSAEERRRCGASGTSTVQSKRKGSGSKLMSFFRVNPTKKQQQIEKPQKSSNSSNEPSLTLRSFASTETIQALPHDPMSSVETFRQTTVHNPSPPSPTIKRKRRSLALMFFKREGNEKQAEENTIEPTHFQMFSADDLPSSRSDWTPQVDHQDPSQQLWAEQIMESPWDMDDVQTASGHSDPHSATEETEEKPLPPIPTPIPTPTPTITLVKADKDKKKVTQNEVPLPVTGKRRFSLKPLRNAFKPTPTGVVIFLPPEEDSGLSSSSEDSASSQQTFRPFGLSRRTAFPSFESEDEPIPLALPNTKLASLHFDELRFDPKGF